MADFAISLLAIADVCIHLPLMIKATELLQIARRAGVSVTVHCGCDGICINGQQVDGGRYSMEVPTGVPTDLLIALVGCRLELELLLTAVGWWSCGCEQRMLEDEIDEVDRDDPRRALFASYDN
jgi:hypothetical protein